MFLISNSDGIELNTMNVFSSNLANLGKTKGVSMTVKQKVVNSSQLTEEKREILCKREKKNQSKSNQV